MKKALLILAAIIVIVVIGLFIFIQTGYDKSFDSEYPVTELTVKADSAMIEHGRYLAYGPAHCAHCHSSIDKLEALERGEEVPMTGGMEFELPIGSLFTPNITPDKETGIGNYSDGTLYRMLRYNIRHDGQACLELMPFFNMTDYDIHSIIAFLRTREPVKSERKENTYNLLGKFVRTVALKPAQPAAGIPPSIKRDSTSAYGKYLCEAVANCMGCHTDRDLKTGAFIGEPYAGGLTFGPDKSTQNWTFVTPNITPDPETGILHNYTEESFINRMRGGRVHTFSPMPWGPFSRLSDGDLMAIYRYLKEIKPVKNKVEFTVKPPAES